MKLSIIIPIYNEKLTVNEILKKVIELDIDKEIIIVDDGSVDGTRDLLSEIILNNDQNLKIILLERNFGKGYAIREGLKYVNGDVVVIQDADLEYDPQDLLRLIKPIQDGLAEVVYGSRTRGKNQISSPTFYLGGLFLSLLTNFLYNTRITDEPTCYKMFKKEIIKGLDLKCSHFEFCPEVTAKIAKKKIKIYELPIKYFPRNKKHGKKINWKDGLVAILTLIKYRFKD
ncbi:MAG: glycosyltransferase family 2 protein [Candidatus Paceibacterota bacterium]|jgi:glycosyltransferase involved in cell wall biosynthesis